MTNKIEMFDSKHYHGNGKPWTKGDTALITFMASVPAFFVTLLLTSFLPALLWVFWPTVSLAIGQAMRKGIQSHQYYGLSDAQVETAKAIEALPPEVAINYGDNYLDTIKRLGDSRSARNLYTEVQQLSEQARITDENRKEHEIAPLVEVFRDTTRDIKQQLKMLDPGVLQLTSGPSVTPKPTRRSAAPTWMPDDDYDRY